jgi:predicted GIY-YIG superfamily endonuclease
MTALVYRAFDANDRLLYIGCTTSFEARMKNHELNSPWWLFRDRIETQEFPTHADALAEESEAIATEHPRWNVRGRSEDHPDGPIWSRFWAPHLADEVDVWRTWIRTRDAERIRQMRERAASGKWAS